MAETVAGMGSLEDAGKKQITPAQADVAAVHQLVKSARQRGE